MSTRNDHTIVTPFLGKEGRAVCERVLDQHLGREPGNCHELLAAFDGLFDRVASDFGLMIGPKGIAAVLQRALRVVGRSSRCSRRSG